MLLDKMVKNSRFLVIKRVEELLDDLGASKPRGCCLVELRGELADSTLFLARALINLRLDYASCDRLPDLNENVGEALDASRVLSNQAPRELKLCLLLVAPRRRLLPILDVLAMRLRDRVLLRETHLYVAILLLSACFKSVNGFNTGCGCTLRAFYALHERQFIHNSFSRLKSVDGNLVLTQTWNFVTLLTARLGELLNIVDLYDLAFAAMRGLMRLKRSLRLVNNLQIELWDGLFGLTSVL